MSLTASIAASTVVVLSVAVKGGTVDQLRINARTGCAGFSWRRELLAWASYAAWVAHGIATRSLVEIGAQGLGVVTSGALLIQVAVHRLGPSPRPSTINAGRSDTPTGPAIKTGASPAAWRPYGRVQRDQGGPG